MTVQTLRKVAAGAALGGLLWALTPLRQPILDAGSSPEEGELVFRLYNVLLVLIAVLLTAGLVALRRTSGTGRLLTVGWWVVLTGHLMILAGCLLSALVGGWALDLVRVAQDVAFLGAVVAGLGALLLGIGGLRTDSVPRPAAVLFTASLPLGFLGIGLLDAAGVPEDYLGLPFTVLYGGAWLVWGLTMRRSPVDTLVAEGSAR